MAKPFNEITTLEQVKVSSAAVLTRKAVAELLGVDPRTVDAGIEDGTIPSIRVGRRVLIPREKFLKLLGAEDD